MEDKKKNKKVGFKTLGVCLILFGILFFIQVIFKVNILRYILIAWPVILVALGAEIIITDIKSEVKISIFSIFLIMILIVSSFGFGALNVLLNEILYTDEYIQSISDNDFTYRISEDVPTININNYSEKIVNLKIVENDSSDPKLHINIKYRIGKNNISNILSRLDDDFYKNCSIKDGIDIYNIKDNIESVNLIIVTDDISKVKTSGKIEIVK